MGPLSQGRGGVIGEHRAPGGDAGLGHSGKQSDPGAPPRNHSGGGAEMETPAWYRKGDINLLPLPSSPSSLASSSSLLLLCLHLSLLFPFFFFLLSFQTFPLLSIKYYVPGPVCGAALKVRPL